MNHIACIAFIALALVILFRCSKETFVVPSMPSLPDVFSGGEDEYPDEVEEYPDEVEEYPDEVEEYPDEAEGVGGFDDSDFSLSMKKIE
jgi:hypothetical protein